MAESEEEEVPEDYYASENIYRVCAVHKFREEEYEGEALRIGRMLQGEDGVPKSRGDIRKKERQTRLFFLEDGLLWKENKKAGGLPTRVVGTMEQKNQIMTEFHESEWAGHRGTWATFMKIKQKYWWKGMYRDIAEFTGSCEKCQMYSGTRHRDELHPTFSPTINLKWMVDIVAMPTGIGQRKYLVLAREDLSNQVEGRALRKKTSSAVCQFLLEEVFCRYGCVGQVVADRGELDSNEAREFFAKHGVRLTLTTAYNPEANGKIERGHSPIVKALVKACNGNVKNWPHLLAYALWADRTTHSSVTGYMPMELMTGQTPIMPTEAKVTTWGTLPWKTEMSREELLTVRIRQLEGREEDIAEAARRQHEARLRNKQRFDQRHRLRPRKIEDGDWVIVYDSSLDHQHSTTRKFARRWFGPYEVRQVRENGTYLLSELDGTLLRSPIAGKRVKIFKKREEADPYVDLEGDTVAEEEETNGVGGPGNNEDGVELVIELAGVSDDGD